MMLAGLQTERMARALADLGPNAHEAARRFLVAMIDTDGRDGGQNLITRAARARRRRSGPDGEILPPVLVPNPPADDAPHLLVVDDDRRIRDLLSRFLSTEGYRISTADSAA